MFSPRSNIRLNERKVNFVRKIYFWNGKLIWEFKTKKNNAFDLIN